MGNDNVAIEHSEYKRSFLTSDLTKSNFDMYSLCLKSKLN